MHNRVLAIGLRSTFLASAAIALPTPLVAQTARAFHFDMPAQPMARALRQLARQTGAQIMFSPDDVAGLTAPRLQGDMATEEAIRRLIAGTDLTAEKSASAIVIRGKAHLAAKVATEAPVPDDIVITGSRIRGAVTASPIMRLSRNDIARSGQSNLGDAVRNLPQSFGGGQNPGVGVGAGGAPDNVNVSSGSTINLRGIGQDATLTLLNGHRVAYNAAYQGVDVSSIPLAAIERLDILLDGASALYGSDAVGGVANIILRRDFDGLWTSARLGGSTDGGNFQQQYSAVAGQRWSSGGYIATSDYGRDTGIRAGQRTITASLNPAQTLIPYQKHYSTIFSGHQEVGRNLQISFDATSNYRSSNFLVPINSSGNYLDYGSAGYNRTSSFSLAPSIRYQSITGWSVNVLGVYGEDKARYGSDLYRNGSVINRTRGCYCNNFENVDVAVEGPVSLISGGAIRVAAGGGYRENGFHAYRTAGTAQNIDVSQGVYYAYGEIYAPLVSERNASPGVAELYFNGALRYEDYGRSGRILTPKAGVVYSPIAGFHLKGSWGQSFRAPTLYSQFSVQYASLYPVAALGGSGNAAGQLAIFLSGANPDLQPERATTWTITGSVDPTALAGFHAEVSYYHISYDNRVVTPIPSRAAALSNVSYASFVQKNPPLSDIDRITRSTDYVFTSYAGATFSKNAIVAIVDNRYQNISSQLITGFDLSARYELKTEESGVLTVLTSGSYLNSKQKLSAGDQIKRTSGTIFYAPHFRGRAGLLWDNESLSLSSYLNYIGGVEDDRQAIGVPIRSMVTLDFGARYKIHHSTGVLSGVEISLFVQNLNNAMPGHVKTAASYFLPYDSTNYSPVGRTVTVSVSKAW